MTDSLLTLTHATERDIDLLLIEELKCSRSFVEWFRGEVAKRVGRITQFESFEVTHSKRRQHVRREIDITLNLLAGDHRTIFLIENKLDTSPQPKQAESYREEAALLIAGGVQNVWTILICPNEYYKAENEFSDSFDVVITYEVIKSFFLRQSKIAEGELSARLGYRAALMDQAITKARRGYSPVPLPAVSRFASRYVELLKEKGIELPPGPSMLKESAGGESKTMIFAPTAIPSWPFLPQMRLVHQLREANANLCFYTWGDLFSHLAGVIGADLDGTTYRLVPTINKRVGGRSGLMIVVDTPFVDNLGSFDNQIAAIEEGQRNTLLLRDWFASRRSVVERWARRAEEFRASRAAKLKS
jgi:hypothetical protein